MTIMFPFRLLKWSTVVKRNYPIIYISETEYFGKVGKVMAALAFPMFMMFPVIRGLPIKSRVFSASLPAYYCYYWGSWYKEHLWWVKSNSFFFKCLSILSLPKIYCLSWQASQDIHMIINH